MTARRAGNTDAIGLPTREQLTGRIDQTRLTPGLRREEIGRFCREAIDARFHSVCLLPACLETAAAALRDSPVRLAGVVGFPHGGTTRSAKIFEAVECRQRGAVELDVVVDLGAIRDGDFRRLDREIGDIQERTPECTHKFILELGLLTDPELAACIEVFNARRPAFLKTSTGTLPPPVDPDRVRWIRERLRPEVEIKAAGGIRTLRQVEEYLAAGATRIGTSTGLRILQEWESRAAGDPGPPALPAGAD